MAILYIANVNCELKTIQQIINQTFTHDLFEITNKSIWTSEDLENLKKRCSGFDTVHIKDKVVMEPHTHEDNEDRLIISGVGHFFIPCKDEVYIIKATEGDFVSLKKDTVHWFSCKKHLVAGRFFENEKSYKASMKNIPHEIYRLKDSFEDLTNIKI